MKREFLKSLLISAAIATGASGALALELQDYCDVKYNQPKGIKEMTPLKDGESFAAISDDGNSIEVYSYKTGEKISNLFSLSGIKGEVKIEGFDGYSLSANEKKILLWNNVKMIYRYSFTADYYVYDILRSTLAKVSEEGGERGAVISHDGRMVAYVRDNNIQIANLDYKTTHAVTKDGKVNEVIYGVPDWSYEEEFGVLNTMRWSADDNVLAYMRFDERDVPVYSFDNYKPFSASDPLGDRYPESYSYKYPLAGYPVSKVEVYAYNLDNRVSKKMDLQIGESYVPSLEFDGKGENLMAMILNRDQNNLQLLKVNPGSTVAHPVINQHSEAWLSPSAYQMVKYYADSFVIGSEESGYRHLYEYDYSGNLRRQISKGNWNVTDYYGRDLKGNHFMQTTQNGAINRNVAMVDSKGSCSMLNPEHGTESASFSSNMNYFVRKYSSASVPPQYTICNSKGKTLKELEMNREYAAKYSSVVKPEFIKVKNDAGQEMDASIIKPANFRDGLKYPVMFYQYNGPDSQLVLNSWSMNGSFYIASKGYVVASIDGRGTGNRDRAWSTCVYKNLGDLEVKDQIAGAKEIGKLPYVNSDKMACFGWSFGGYMTLMEAAAENCPFKAGAAMASVTDWRLYDAPYTERYMLTPQQNETGYNASSALLKSENVKIPLLIMSGSSDDNVHYYNTLKYTSKLNQENKSFDMMIFTGMEHSLRTGNARNRLYSKLLDFLDTNLNK